MVGNLYNLCEMTVRLRAMQKELDSLCKWEILVGHEEAIKISLSIEKLVEQIWSHHLCQDQLLVGPAKPMGREEM